MTDIVGKHGTRNMNPLFHSKVEISGSLVQGRASTGGRRNYINYPSNFYTNSISHLSALPENDDAAWARFIAGTAPHRQSFLTPAFLAELKDVPNLIRYGGGIAKYLKDLATNPRRRGQVGNLFGGQGISPEAIVEDYRPTFGNALSKAKKLGQANLALRFGVAPFQSDLRTALNFAAGVEARRKEIDKLYSEGGLARSWDLGEKTDEYVNLQQQLHSVTGAKVDVRVQRQVKRWGMIRYYPRARSGLPPTDDELMRQLLGFSLSGALLSVYEVTPWSWLLDYFTNLGDHLAATVNTTLVSGKGCLMQQFSIVASHGTTGIHSGSQQWDLTSGLREERVRHRTVRTTATNVSFSADTLGLGQLSILGSLASTKIIT